MYRYIQFYNLFNLLNHFYTIHKPNHQMKKLLYLVLIASIFSSCYSTKDLNYIQGDEYSQDEVTTFHNNRLVYEVQPNDVLSITVQSLDPEQSSFFNIDRGTFNNANQAALFLNGYSVDENGYINLPIVGLIKVSGLTVDEVQRLIQKEISNYLIDAIVLAKLVSYRITVLGEVNEPGTYYIYNTKATLFEGLSLAGGLKIGAERKTVKLIRQIEDSGYVIELDLTKPSLMETPYYYLLPNDVVYVEISNESVFRENLPLITTFFALVSTTILMLNFLNNN